MSFLNFLYSLIILPLENIIEFVFNFTLNKLSRLGVGGAIVCVSMAVNFLALPLYNIADKLQLKERNIQKKMEGWIKHIKKTFKGDEQYMMISTYYRLNGYNPLYSLRSALSILIEIPFFIAAYHYLSNCNTLKNQSFLFLQNLGEPDNLIKIGGLSIHLLPILMTAINCISGWVYSKDAHNREKVQIYMLAAIFLVLLYNSPSGLVLYWILNNLFSLAKNIVQKYYKKPGMIVAFCLDAACIFVSLYFAFFRPETSIKKKLVVYAATIFIVIVPYLLKLFNKWFKKEEKIFIQNKKSYFGSFLFSALSLALLCGTLLPSSMISTSPVEFSFLGNTDSPLTYIITSFALSSGLFVVWPLAIYLMFCDRVKYAETYLFAAAAVCALFNTFVFRQNYGTVSISGELSNPDILTRFSPLLIAGPILIITASIFILLLSEKFNKLQFAAFFMLAVNSGYIGLTIKNTKQIQHEYKLLLTKGNKIQKKNEGNYFDKIIRLNKNGQNVIVFFLDRAMGLFVPYIFEQFPELNDVYTGFTFYPNTVSFSDFTNEGMTGLYGGYEYSVDKINARSNELLAKKSDESQLVIPRLFTDADWTATLVDSQYPNYEREGEKTLFDSYPKIELKKSEGIYTNLYLETKAEFTNIESDKLCKKKLVRFCFLQSILPVARKIFYNAGNYYTSSGLANNNFDYFLGGYTGLYYLPQTTSFDSSSNSYVMFHNNTTHNIKLLKEPDYHPEPLDDEDFVNINALFPYKTVPADNESSDLAHYECNAAALLQISKWITYLKENDCYNNTRIILVGDHGRDAVHYISEDGKKDFFHTLLMVKDFYSSGKMKTEKSFMTNADTPWLSIKDLPLNNKNPFSGTEISEEQAEKEKTNGVNVWHCLDWQPNRHKNDTKFETDINEAWHVGNDIYNEENWIPMKEWIKNNPDDISVQTAKGGVK